jgi:hypothetical protein
LIVGLSLDPGQEVTAEADFDLTETYHDSYYVKGHFGSDRSADSWILMVPRDEVEIGAPLTYSLMIDIDDIPKDLTEGDDLFINGTVARNDTKLLSGVAVGVRILGLEDHYCSETDVNGTFSLMISDLLPGNWTIMVQAMVGDWSKEETIPISVALISSDDDDIVDDDDVDDDDISDDDTTDDDTDDDTTDDDITDDDLADDVDDSKTNWGIVGGVLIGIILLLGVTIFIVLMIRGYKEEEMDWDE